MSFLNRYEFVCILIFNLSEQLYRLYRIQTYRFWFISNFSVANLADAILSSIPVTLLLSEFATVIQPTTRAWLDRLPIDGGHVRLSKLLLWHKLLHSWLLLRLIHDVLSGSEASLLRV